MRDTRLRAAARRGAQVVALFAACVLFAGAAQWGWQHVRAGQWEQGRDYFTRAIVQESAPASGGRIERLTDLYVGWLACEYFPRAENSLAPAQARAVHTWLLSRAEFTRTFLLALRPEDDVGRAFEILHTLLSHSAQAVDRFPQMAIAFCVTWDGYMRDRELLAKSFSYYVDNAGEMTYNPASLPYELLVYVVDTRRDLRERRWALERFAGSEDIGRHYERIWRYKYDRQALLYGRESALAGREKTLQNIRKYGGLSDIAALYASEIGKATGVPSVRIRDVVPGFGGAAGMGFLRVERSEAHWSLSIFLRTNVAGLRFFGKVRDPHTGRDMPSEELAFGSPSGRSRAERRVAEVWRRVAELLAENRETVAARRAILNSFNTGIYDRRQWHTLAALAERGIIPQQKVITALDMVTGRLQRYPDLAADAFAALASALPQEQWELRLSLYDRMAERMEDASPGTEAQLLLLKAQYLEQLGRTAEALDICVETLQDGSGWQEWLFLPALELLDNATRIMLDQGRNEEAIELHEEVMHRLGRPRRTAAMLSTAWGQVALRAAKLHALSGDQEEHDDRIEVLVERLPLSDEDEERLNRRLSRLDYHQLVRGR
ncbi:MAG: hypothetical protein R6V05_05215 [Candidatus Brocadiia bacterium]